MVSNIHSTKIIGIVFKFIIVSSSFCQVNTCFFLQIKLQVTNHLYRLWIGVWLIFQFILLQIKYVTILFAIFISVQSQRPPYAGSSKPYPAVLPQYLEGVTAGAASINTIGNRIDSNNGNTPLMGAAAPSTPMAIPTIPPDLPVDALGDVNLINRIKTWPKDKQPFWFLNWQKIQEHRGDSKNRAQPVETQPNQRSFFAG